MGRVRRRKTIPIHRGKHKPRLISFEGLESRTLLSATPVIGLATQNSAVPASAASALSAGIQGYSPAQVANAYGFQSGAAAGANGSGQTIAIVEAYRNTAIVSDLAAFDKQFNLPAVPSLQQVNQFGGKTLPGTNSTWSQETALDVEWAHAVAPGANIVIVEANSDRLVDLVAAVDAARRIADVSVVSISWGVNESGGRDIVRLSLFGAGRSPEHHIRGFIRRTHVSIAGAMACGFPERGRGRWLDADVGRSRRNHLCAELPWTGTDSGASEYEPAPAYQKSSTRVVPDVVYNADPSNGFAVYEDSGGNRGWVTLGGTSAGRPQWPSLIALAV